MARSAEAASESTMNIVEVVAPADRAVVDPCLHPRPSLMRARWRSLDGPWQFAWGHDPAVRPAEMSRTIEVPFAPESPRSGIGEIRAAAVTWYRRTIELPEEWRGQRILLHFNAVDWQATVWVAGQRVAEHAGGYSPFAVDVTELVSHGLPVELLVRAHDDPSEMAQPRGKQDWRAEPHSIWYPRTSGIWQSVWWEAVPEVRVGELRFDADLASFSLGMRLKVEGVGSDGRPPTLARVIIGLRGRVLVDDLIALTGPLTRRRFHLADPGIDDARAEFLWSPEQPNLLDVEVRLLPGGRGTDAGPDGVGRAAADSTSAVGDGDRVFTKTAMRTVEARGGAVLLNGRPYRLRLALDQGYWPDSHLTPPDPEALGRDVTLAKELGFNGVRKHQKLEDPRFYAWADRLGLLVWVELPSAYSFDETALTSLTSTWAAAVRQAAAHPSVIAWVVFNESWGVPDLPLSAAQRSAVRGLAELTRALDQTRLVVGNDGWEVLASDLVNVHDYSADPAVLSERYGTRQRVADTLAGVQPAGRRLLLDPALPGESPVLLSEFGGVRIEDGAPGWGYSAVPDAAAFLVRYRELLAVVDAAALAGFCYTQLTDTFQERNGLLTMEREPKADMAALARATRGER